MNVCRVCLSSSTERDIHQLQSHIKGTSKNSVDIFHFCLNIEIETDSNVNTKLCLRCFEKVRSYYKFKCLALKSDEYLKNVLSSESRIFIGSIKTEDVKNDNECLVFLPDTKHSWSGVKVEFDAFGRDDDALQDYQSDDELLSVIKKIKYENVVKDEPKENGSIKRKRGRVKKPKPETGSLMVCEECGKAVKNVREHQLMHRPDRKRFKCKECDKTFASYSARLKHYKIKHLGIKKKCPICNKAVVDLKVHDLRVHKTSSLPFLCVVCEKRFISQMHLDEHMRMHTKERPIQCDVCEKTFRTKIVMLQHKRQVHDKEKAHLCQFCSKSFFKKFHLQQHLRIHTKEKPHKCEECGRCFGTSTVLRNHRTLHSDLKPFPCALCDMTFARSGYLRTHMISHTKEKRHECKYCGVKFGRSDHRNRHELTAHERHRQPPKLADLTAASDDAS